MSVPAEILACAVRAYQLTVRPLIGGHCRFEPSCSHYAIAALRRHGAARGATLSAARILRCNPWNDGGYDPVPDAVSTVAQKSSHAGMSAPTSAHANHSQAGTAP